MVFGSKPSSIRKVCADSRMPHALTAPGRLVRVSLGCLCADRPAAVDLTGGPAYQAEDSPCLRCTVSKPDISSHTSAPHRDSAWHNRAVLKQLIEIPLAVAADKELFRNEEAARIRGTKRKPRSYTKVRQIQATEAATITCGNVSALALLPGYDQFRAATFDPMHSLLEGLLKTYFYKVLSLGEEGLAEAELDRGAMPNEGEESDALSVSAVERLGLEAQNELDRAEGGQVRLHDSTTTKGLKRIVRDSKTNPKALKRRILGPRDMARLRELLLEVSAPTSIGRLHREWGGPAAGNPTADDWRSFALVYGPLVLPRLWREVGPTSAGRRNHRMIEDELRAMMLLFEIIALSFRASISDTQLRILDKLIPTWQHLALRLHPTLLKKTNLHVVSHLTEDIRRYGPMYGWWSYPVERLNYVIKNSNVSGGADNPEIVAFRAFLKKRDVDSASERVFSLANPGDEVEAEALNAAKQAFAVSSRTAATTLAEIATRYGEMDGTSIVGISPYRAGNLVTRFRGQAKSVKLDAMLYQSLRICLSRRGIKTRTELIRGQSQDASLPFCPNKADFWPGIEWEGVRIDAAEWSVDHSDYPDETECIALVHARNSVIELRDPVRHFACDNSKPVWSGVLTKIFEHQVLMPDGSQGPKRLFGVLRRFVPHGGLDAYGYGDL